MWRIFCVPLLVVAALWCGVYSLAAFASGRPTVGLIWGLCAGTGVIVAAALTWRWFVWVDARSQSLALPADSNTLRRQLRRAGIPDDLHGKFVEFQEKYAGKEGDYGGNGAVWGILLNKTHDFNSAMIPGRVEAFCDDGVWQVVCADIHASDTLTIDQFGRLYWCYSPRYSSFDRFFQKLSPDLSDDSV